MLAVYISILLFGLLLWAFISDYSLDVKSFCVSLFLSIFFGIILTVMCSAFTANSMKLKQADSMISYELYEVESDYVIENRYGDYIVIYDDGNGNMNVLTCDEDRTVFVNEGEVPTISIYSGDYKSPILRHLFFNMVADDYVISCDFDAVKPYIKTP